MTEAAIRGPIPEIPVPRRVAKDEQDSEYELNSLLSILSDLRQRFLIAAGIEEQYASGSEFLKLGNGVSMTVVNIRGNVDVLIHDIDPKDGTKKLIISFVHKLDNGTSRSAIGTCREEVDERLVRRYRDVGLELDLVELAGGFLEAFQQQSRQTAGRGMAKSAMAA